MVSTTEQQVEHPTHSNESDQANDPPSDEATSGDARQYASAKELSLLSTAFTVATFMIAIDGSILSTAIPKITSDFHRLDHVSWYGSAYLLTEMSCQPTFGRLYKLCDARILYLVSIIIFESGSILCAAAPNSVAFIVGRAILGMGAAGLLCGSLTIFGRSVPLRQRPFGMAVITSMYGVAGVIGPTLGGVITDTPRLTWRFVFWMNLPAGAVTFAIAYFTFKTRPPPDGHLSLSNKLRKTDLPSGLILTGSLVGLFIALEWGGFRYAWSNPKVWGCLLVFGVLATAFIVQQARQKEDASIPIRILSQRTVAVGCTFNFLLAMAQNTHNYYLSIFYQAVQGTSAAVSGVRLLAYGVPGSVAIILVGWLMTSRGHYVPFFWAGSALSVAGCALLHTLTVDAPVARWFGYSVLAGIGIGASDQIPFIAVQVVLPDDDMPTACALVVFSRCLGGAVGLSVAGNLFQNALVPRLQSVGGLDVAAVVAAGLTDLVGAVPADKLRAVREAVNGAVSKTFVLPIAVAAIGLVVGLGMEWRRIPSEEDEEKAHAERRAVSTTTLTLEGDEETKTGPVPVITLDDLPAWKGATRPLSAVVERGVTDDGDVEKKTRSWGL